MPARHVAERTVIRWRVQRDHELLEDLDRYTARQRGHRLRYLARLGLMVEADGASLSGRAYDGELVRPAHWGSGRMPQTPVSTTLTQAEPEDDPLGGLTATLLGGIEG